MKLEKLCVQVAVSPQEEEHMTHGSVRAYTESDAIHQMAAMILAARMFKLRRFDPTKEEASKGMPVLYRYEMVVAVPSKSVDPGLENW